MGEIFALNALESRIHQYLMTEGPTKWKPRYREYMSRLVLGIYRRGEISRTEAQGLMGLGETYSRAIIKEAIENRFISSPTPKGKLSIEFTANVLESFFPKLILG